MTFELYQNYITENRITVYGWYLLYQHTTWQSLTVQAPGRQPLAELVYVRGGFHKAYLRSHSRLPTRNFSMACCRTCAQRNRMNMQECKAYVMNQPLMMIISRYCEFVAYDAWAYDAWTVDKVKGHDTMFISMYHSSHNISQYLSIYLNISQYISISFNDIPMIYLNDIPNISRHCQLPCCPQWLQPTLPVR